MQNKLSYRVCVYVYILFNNLCCEVAETTILTTADDDPLIIRLEAELFPVKFAADMLQGPSHRSTIYLT